MIGSRDPQLHIAAMSELDHALRVAESLAPDDRLRLIARLWARLPPDHWAAPTTQELAEVERRLRDYDTRRASEAPWEIVREILAEREARSLEPATRATSPVAKIYSAPRRFDLATIFIATAAYAILFTGMTLLDFGPGPKLYAAVLITCVGAGQALLLDVLDPRRASVLVGATVHSIFSLILYSMEPRAFFHSVFIAVTFVGVLGGVLMGYLAGVLAAGVFLVADMLRGKMALRQARAESPAAEATPWDLAATDERTP